MKRTLPLLAAPLAALGLLAAPLSGLAATKDAPAKAAPAAASAKDAGSNPKDGPSKALCLPFEELIDFQFVSDGYIHGVNPEWTWSHSAWAASAKPGHDVQPDWVNEQFPWMKKVPAKKWTLMMPWYVVGTKAGDESDAIVEVGEMSVQYFSASKKRWISLGSGMQAKGGIFGKGATGSGKPDAATDSIIKLDKGRFAHGWFDFVKVPPRKDIKAMSIAVQLRTKTPTPVLAEAGADYYPEDWRERLGDGPLMPGLGTSAPRLVGQEWKTIVFTTLSEQTHDGSGLSPEELKKHRPHCN
ncbi:MAG: hypothetical protein Q4D19_12745 [Lautropia sp.]|nr:hypothetical protein [Lautropia sp.]